jgi:hypothetical protein
MATLLVGMLVVAAGAVGFGFALFGRRPLPQTATEVPGAQLAPAAVLAGRPRAVRPTAPQDDVSISGWMRIRAALVLALTVLGIAAIIGGVLSVVVVGLVLIVT